MDMNTHQRIAGNIRYLRQLTGNTQYTLSDVVGLARCTYAQLESGVKTPTVDTLQILAEFYGISVDTLVHMRTQKFNSHIILFDRCLKQLPKFLEIYNQLSPEGKAQLNQMAEELTLQEETGEMPGFTKR